MAAARKGLISFTSIICSPSLTSRDNLGEFFREHRRAEGFDNIVAGLGLDRIDDILFPGLGGNYQEGKTL